MTKTIKYANYALLKAYMDGGQRRYCQANVADLKNDLFVVGMNFIHNDGPDVRTTFMINKAGAEIVVDVPLDVFNRLPTYTPTAEELAS